jgi:SAM-dependent methyltransferase
MSVPLEHPSPNYDYLVARTKAWPSGQRLLDFGCSSGTLVRRARSAGIEAFGADAYEQHSPGCDNTGDAAPYLHRIENDQLPFPDQSFDVVTSNMVFEHVQPDRLPAGSVRSAACCGRAGCCSQLSRCAKRGSRDISTFTSRIRSTAGRGCSAPTSILLGQSDWAATPRWRTGRNGWTAVSKTWTASSSCTGATT